MSLTVEENDLLTRVGPGTPLGEMLRRSWLPACLSDEIPEPDGDPIRVRLLGEDLIAFRDTAGRVGVMQHRCPHRASSLFFGGTKRAASVASTTVGRSTLRATYWIRRVSRWTAGSNTT